MKASKQKEEIINSTKVTDKEFAGPFVKQLDEALQSFNIHRQQYLQLNLSQSTSNLKRSLEDAYSRVREHLGTTVERQKEVYDLKVHGKAFEIGDLVWLHNPVVGRGIWQRNCTIHGVDRFKS
ncbi:hypothetical protein EMCRGX_G012712 [Ephydatia muelleri]